MTIHSLIPRPIPSLQYWKVRDALAEDKVELDFWASILCTSIHPFIHPGLFYNGTTGQLACFNTTEEFIECADPTGCGTGPDSLAWDYQVCLLWPVWHCTCSYNNPQCMHRKGYSDRFVCMCVCLCVCVCVLPCYNSCHTAHSFLTALTNLVYQGFCTIVFIIQLHYSTVECINAVVYCTYTGTCVHLIACVKLKMR